MGPGTIVVCLRTEVTPFMTPYVKWMPVMDEKTPYMIREYIPPERTDTNIGAVFFEEGTLGIGPNGNEIGYPLPFVREILPAEDIAEQVEEMMLEPFMAIANERYFEPLRKYFNNQSLSQAL